jgi:hypothetical protein
MKIERAETTLSFSTTDSQSPALESSTRKKKETLCKIAKNGYLEKNNVICT